MKANMSTNCLLPVKSLSKNEALATACFFYEICTDIEEFRNIEECQTLYKALVSALSCKKHAAKVTKAFIQRHVRDKKLTPLDDSGEARNIFDFRGKLSRTYKEDSTVYDKCGSWSSDSEQDRISPALIVDELCGMQEEKDGTASRAIGFSV